VARKEGNNRGGRGKVGGGNIEGRMKEEDQGRGRGGEGGERE